jgi:hypothetical protein
VRRSWPSDEVYESELAGTRHCPGLSQANDTAGFPGSSPRPESYASRHRRAFWEAKQLITRQRRIAARQGLGEHEDGQVV